MFGDADFDVEGDQLLSKIPIPCQQAIATRLRSSTKAVGRTTAHSFVRFPLAFNTAKGEPIQITKNLAAVAKTADGASKGTTFTTEQTATIPYTASTKAGYTEQLRQLEKQDSVRGNAFNKYWDSKANQLNQTPSFDLQHIIMHDRGTHGSGRNFDPKHHVNGDVADSKEAVEAQSDESYYAGKAAETREASNPVG